MSSITDKTRKILWGRSGNLCAICKHELIVDATKADDEAVVGDECHIISPELNGPRHDPKYPEEKLSSYDNLILLCRTHHKMVDDQAITFTPEILRQIKNNHEAMISERLADKQKVKPVRLRRIKQNIPDFLIRISTGKQLVDLITGTYAFSMDNDELTSQEEADLVANFFQELRDWIDIIDEMEPSDRIRGAFNLTKLITEIEEKGFYVFGGRETELLEGGIVEEPSRWPVAIVHVLRNDNKAIIYRENKT